MSQIMIQQPIPAFSVPLYPEGQLTEQSLLGQWTVIYFYPKDNTPGCTQESVEFQQLLDQFSSLGCRVIGVSRDGLKSHQNFAQKHGLSFPLVSDRDEVLCRLFDVLKEKMNYGRKYIGIERSTFLINPKGELVAEWRKVSVKEHVQSVIAVLQNFVGEI
jgi:peroxiredoxin Q/BCP